MNYKTEESEEPRPGRERLVFLQQIVNGLVIGGVYALFALGFTLIFGIHKIMNLAHGGIFMTGAFIGLYSVQAGLPLWLAFILAMFGAGLVSVIIEVTAFRRLRQSGEVEFSALISSIGANLVLVSIAQMLSKTQVLRFPFDTFPVVIFKVWGLRVSALQLAMAVLAILLVAGLSWYLYRTGFGRQVRAVAQNERAALLAGIRPSVIYFQTFMLSGMLAGAAGVLVGLAFNSIHFMMGDPFLLRGFVVVILGGLGSVAGALVASLGFGVLQTLSVAYLSSRLSDIIIFGLLFAVLLLRPNGLFGQDEAGVLRGRR